MLSPWICSLAVTPLLLAIGLLRWPLKNRLPRATFPALWSIALLRLLIPLDIPSPVSVFSLAERVDRWLAGRAQAAGATVTPPVYTQNGMLPAAMPVSSAPPQANVAAQTHWLVWIWLIVACLMGLYLAIGYLRSRRMFAASLPVDSPDMWACMPTQRTRRPVRLRYSDRVASPLTYGVLRPVILLPRTALSLPQDALRYILAHEMAHIRRFDACTKLLMTAALCVHWFNPLVWIMRVLAVRDMEMACDERVIRGREAAPQSAYALTLLGMEARRGQPFALVNNFSQYAIEERIHAIMNMKKRSFFSTFAALLLVVGLSVVFATSAMAAEPAAPLTPAATNTESTQALSAAGMTTAAAYLPQEVQWYTYEEYAAWLEAEKTALQSLIGTGAGYWTPAGMVEWTQEAVDTTVAMYEDILAQIQAGALVSKPALVTAANAATLTEAEVMYTFTLAETDAVEAMAATSLTVVTDADGKIISSTNTMPAQVGMMSVPGVAMTVDSMGATAITQLVPANAAAGQAHSASIALNDKTVVVLGPYDTSEALVDAVRAFCTGQVAAGLMDQAQVDEILAQYAK